MRNVSSHKTEVLINDLSPGVNYQFKIYPIINHTILYDGVEDNMISILTSGSQLPSIFVDSIVVGSTVSLKWSPPLGNYSHIDWEYAVYVGPKVNELRLHGCTKDTKIMLKNLYSCEHYIAQVRLIEPFGLGPASHDHKFNTTFDRSSPPKNLKYEALNSEKTKYKISWSAACAEHFDEKIGYIVSVNDLICDCEDRFRLQPTNFASNSFELSVHYSAIYEIKVSTDDIRWSEKIILKPPSMPKVVRPYAYIDESGKIFIVWKTIDNYPKDYQTHKYAF